jgi:hypothetical protein
VQTRVEHDDGERQHVARVRVGEDVGVELAVALRERLHHAVDLLRLARKPEAPEELAQRLHQDQIRKVVQVHEGLEHLLVERRLLAQVVADGRLAQTLAPKQRHRQWRVKCAKMRHLPVEESCDVLRSVLQQSLLHQELDALLGVHVELLAAQGQLLGPRRVFAATKKTDNLRR